MKILIISRNAGEMQSPVISVRIIEYLEYLKDEGYLEYAVISENEPIAIKMLTWADCVIFNKHFSDNAYHMAFLAKEKKIKIIYDIDDQIFAWPESHKSLYNRDASSFKRFVEIADMVTVENIRICLLYTSRCV